MKKIIMALMTLMISMAVSAAVWAGPFETYYDYEIPGGKYSYYFELGEGVFVTLDRNWYQNTRVIIEDSGASFYHKASYNAYGEEGLKGGRLFTIGASVNSSFQDLPSFRYIGFEEENCMNIYADLPTDYQAYTADDNIRAEYDGLWAGVEDVIAGIRIGSDEQADGQEVGQEVGQEAGQADRQEVGQSDGQPDGQQGITSSGPDFSTAGNELNSGKPQVSFSDWSVEAVSDTTNAYSRAITVSDGGNYLMTWLDIKGDRYYYYYDAIFQGSGVQKVFSGNWESEEIRNGKLFPFESMDECDMDIDQIITDHVSIQASDSSPFILIFRPNGGKYDGTIQTVTVMNGKRDLLSDSYKETRSIELLGVFRFPEEDRSALHFGENVIQPDYTGFMIQMTVTADVADGIAMMVYTNSSGNEVSVVQPVMDGYGVLTVHDSAQTAEEITVGNFGIAAFSCNAADAVFEDGSGGHTEDTESGRPAGPAPASDTESGRPAGPDPAAASISDFLTGGNGGGPGTNPGVDQPKAAEHRIILTGDLDVFQGCPESAKAGEKVTVYVVGVADAVVVLDVNGEDIGSWENYYTYSFTMPDEDVEINGRISTAGYPGA